LVYIVKKTIWNTMAKKLYVGGLPYATTDVELKDAFSQAGSVSSATVIMDRMTGRSKGFGFVEMTSDEEAMKAMEMWNGKDFGGRTLTVNEARPMEERPRGGNGGGFRGGNDRGGYGGGRGNGGNRW
jgi:RNA recognition motif-containing protein